MYALTFVGTVFAPSANIYANATIDARTTISFSMNEDAQRYSLMFMPSLECPMVPFALCNFRLCNSGEHTGCVGNPLDLGLPLYASECGFKSNSQIGTEIPLLCILEWALFDF